jgi:FMN phosphatase YigB (HAD superfamily)
LDRIGASREHRDRISRRRAWDAPPCLKNLVGHRNQNGHRCTVAPSPCFSYTTAMALPHLSPGSADALLFDLGRVVLDIDFGKAIACWSGHAGCAPDDIVKRFVRAEAYRDHEVGKISDADYFESLRAALGIGISDAQFLEGWNAIFAGEMPGIAPLLARAAKRLPLYVFSNTNNAHVEYFTEAYAGLLGHFREIFLSSTIGLRKPDPAAYDHVVRAIGVPASRILFFDDLASSLRGAKRRSNPAFFSEAKLDCFAALAMTAKCGVLLWL